MEIVLNEIAWAENAIREHAIGARPSETLGRISKYYIHEKGLSPRDTRDRLEGFLLDCDKSASLVTWEKTIDRAVKYGAKYPPIVIDSIAITKQELSVIDSLNGIQLRRLAFTLLCLAKYMNMVNSDIDYWVNTPDKDVMRMANINTSVKRQSLMYGQLRDEGLIRFSRRVDNLSVQVLFAASSGDVEMTVDDFRNLGYRYMMRFDKKYYRCENCGLICKEKNDKTRGRKRKYCLECSIRVKTAQSINSVMNRRKYINGKDNPYSVYMHVFPDGKRYIGMTSQTLSRRWGNGHGYDDQSDVSLAIATYGWDSVEHYLLYDNLTKEQALTRWEEAVLFYRTYNPDYGYNRTGLQNITADFARTPEDTGRISISPVRLDNHGRIAS